MEIKAYPRIKNAILLSVLVVGVQLVSGLVLGLIISALGSSTESMLFGIVNIVLTVLSFGVAILIGYKKSKQKFNEVFKFNNVSLDYWLAITVFMIGFIIVSSELDNIVNFVLPMPELLRNAFEIIMVKQAFIISIILVGIMPAIMEEMLFRGVILNGFRGNYSQRKAILISALLFGIIHLNPWQFVTAFIVGIISAWICIKTKSIILCMYIHLFNNMIGVIVSKYEEIWPKGFDLAYSETTFQPIWFDIAGVIITLLGIALIRRAVKKAKNVSGDTLPLNEQ